MIDVEQEYAVRIGQELNYAAPIGEPIRWAVIVDAVSEATGLCPSRSRVGNRIAIAIDCWLEEYGTH